MSKETQNPKLKIQYHLWALYFEFFVSGLSGLGLAKLLYQQYRQFANTVLWQEFGIEASEDDIIGSLNDATFIQQWEIPVSSQQRSDNQLQILWLHMEQFHGEQNTPCF